MKNILKKSIFGFILFSFEALASDATTIIHSASDIENHVRTLLDQNITPAQILIFQDLDRCAFYNRAGDITDPQGQEIFPGQLVNVDNELMPRCITEDETDAQLRDPAFKTIIDNLITQQISVMVVTGRPPVRDETIAAWAHLQPLQSLYYTNNYYHLPWRKRDSIKTGFLKSHTDSDLINFAKTKAAMMEINSGLQLSHQERLKGEFSKPNSGSVYINGVAYTGYDKGPNILWYMDQLFLKDIKHIIIVDDDLRSFKSYEDCKDSFKSLGLTLHYLHWKIIS